MPLPFDVCCAFQCGWRSKTFSLELIIEHTLTCLHQLVQSLAYTEHAGHLSIETLPKVHAIMSGELVFARFALQMTDDKESLLVIALKDKMQSALNNH